EEADGLPNPALGERYVKWRFHILWLRYIVHLWQLAKAENTGALSRRIVLKQGRIFFRLPKLLSRAWLEPEILGVLLSTTGSAIVWSKNDPKMGRDVDMLATGDVVLGALLFLQEQFENMGLIALRPRLTLDRNQRRLVFGVVPESLLAALWLQFALAA